MIAGRFVLAMAIAVIGILSLSGTVSLWQIWVESLVVGLMMSLTEPATQTFVFDIVGRDRIQNAVALNTMGTGLARMGGPSLAGVMIAVVGVTTTFFSASAGLVAACALFLTIPIMGHGSATKTTVLGELRSGLGYVRSNPAVMLVLFSCMAALFNGSLVAMRPIFARDVLHVGGAGFGVMAAFAGVGSIIGAVVTAIMPQTKYPGIQTVVSMLFFAATLFLYSFAFSYPYILAIEFLNGFAGQFWQVSIFSGLQISVPEEMRGRIIGLVFTCAQLGFVGQLGVGVLADLTSDRLAMGVFGAVPMIWLTILLILGFKVISTLHPLEDTAPEPA
jgi:predicted MFS family arabinose efflux permease